MRTNKALLISVFLFLSSPFLVAEDWLTDFSKAKELAKTNEQNIILVFQGSDWCIPCIKLEREIWSTEEFSNYAKDHFVLLKADFPRKRKNKLSNDQIKQNEKLAEQYNKQGHFPLVVVLNTEGIVLGTTGYQHLSPKQYIDLLESF